MPDVNSLISMKEGDLVPKKKEESTPVEVNINDELVKMLRSTSPNADWILTDDAIEIICSNIGKGVSIEACASLV